MSSDAVRNGWIDMVSLGRPLLADPDYVGKLKAGRELDIRSCIACQEGCMGRIQKFSMINCAVNPQCARERYFAYMPVLQKKKVVIIGGGVAGMEAARVLAMRGHIPVLYERSDRLGGALKAAGVPEFKEDNRGLIRWYVHTFEQLRVEIHLNTNVTRALLAALTYDTLVIATSGRPKKLDLGNGLPVYNAKSVLLSNAENIGKKTVVIGGGRVGCEMALWLRKECGKTVTIY